jgi:hypothetical protein
VFRRYAEAPSADRPGRYYSVKYTEEGIIISFNRKKHGYGPASGDGKIRIVCADAQSAELLAVGSVLGYDGMRLSLDGFDDVLPGYLSVIAELDGEYRFITGIAELGEQKDDDPLAFDSGAGEIVVLDTGGLEGYTLFVAELATTLAGRGNVRAGSSFEPGGLINPLPAFGGTDRQSAAQLRREFAQDFSRPAVAATPQDYEYFAASCPGLCISKVKAQSVGNMNVMRVAVLPAGASQSEPKLSPLYEKQILTYLESRRLIGTVIEVVPAVFVPVDIRVVVYTKETYEAAEQSGREVLLRLLDGMRPEIPFGSRLSFERIRTALEAAQCIETVYDLNIMPQSRSRARLDGPDLVFAADALPTPGSIVIDVR